LQEQIITTPEELAPCCEYLAQCGRFGLDTEFVGEDSYHPRLCLVQVATPERLILIDPFTAGPLDGFWNLVIDPANQIIVHAGREEVRLCKLAVGQTPGNLFDLQLAAGLVGLPYPMGYGSLVNQLLGVSMTKGETLTEWRERPLTREQVRYAFDDVRYLLPVWEKLERRLSGHGRLEWLAEEVRRLATSAVPEEGTTEKWRKIRGAGSLDRRKLAVLRELFLWREEKAAERNRPPRTIVRDDLLVEIAKRNPTKERDLQVVRGLAKRDLATIVQVVEQGRSVPLEQCPRATEREQDPPQVGLVGNVLLAVLGDLCVRKQLAPNLVCSSNDVKLLVRSRLQKADLPTETLLTQGWRSQYVLPELLGVLDGRRSVRVADVIAEAPFAIEDVSSSAKTP
jgi:ribonuclease D